MGKGSCGKEWEEGRRGEGGEGRRRGGRGVICNLIVIDLSHTSHTSHTSHSTHHTHTPHTHTPHTHTSHPHASPHTSHRRMVWYRTIVIFRPTSQPVESLCTRTRSSCPPHCSLLPPAATHTITLHNMQTMTTQTCLRQMS